MVCKTGPIRLRTEPERAPYRYLFTAEYVPRLPHRLGPRQQNSATQPAPQMPL